MLPITPLMIEHRIIERMIEIAKKELDNFKITNKLNVAFIDNILDFTHTYADQTHHGKEEGILFQELKKKQLSNDHKKIMRELIQAHITGRNTTRELETANN